MELKPIPAFYCCYLLRSTVRKASHYVGSTPHPSRRLGQHNGRVKGGAARTSKASLRPWEMTCIVAGFPSNIAALQFEWAWHNAHLTRHISADQRISFATTLTKTSSRTGKIRKRPGRPRQSLLDKLSNLHLLLRVPYFSRWPLEVRFFNQEVYQSWQAWCERVDEQVRPGIKVTLDLTQARQEDDQFTSAQPPPKRRKINLIGQGGVDGVDPTYAQFQDVVEKGKFLLDEGDGQKCQICSEGLDMHNDLFVICPSNGCQSLSHLTCLSNRFLQQTQSSLLVPESGKCPSCRKTLQWSDLMKELSLRTRGEKEVKKLLGKRKKTKTATAAEILDSESDDDDDELGAEFEESDDDAMSVASLDSVATFQSRVIEEPKSGRLEIVIEDSDDEG